jgi:KUP system potassium uptake protein
LTVLFEEYPRVPLSRRAEVTQVAEGLWHVIVRFGFTEMPNVVAALANAREQGCPLNLDDAVYIASHDEVVRSPTRPRLAAWRRMLFSVMFRNSVRAPDRFDLPADKLLEVGRQIAL